MNFLITRPVLGKSMIAGFPDVLILPNEVAARLIPSVHEGIAISKEDGSTVFRNQPDCELP